MNSLAISKLKWHSRRSMLELDLYLMNFIKNGGLEQLSPDELVFYQQLLAYEDQYLLALLLQHTKPINANIQGIINKIYAKCQFV